LFFAIKSVVFFYQLEDVPMRVFRSITFVTGLIFFSYAHAALHLELTQGVNGALPIAIVPFANQTDSVPGNTTLSQVISNDLQNSGEFSVKTGGMLSQQPTSLAAIQPAYWQKQGINDVVVGQVQQTGGDRFLVSFQLADVNALGANKNSAALLSQTFSTNRNGLRQLAHHISDMIYQKLTGVRGVFSTKIAYVLVQNYGTSSARYQLIVADQDGFAPQALLSSAEPMMSPTWSPDGRSIAYVSFENHRATIKVQNLATGARQTIAQYPGMNNAPAFSPNGRRMAMVLTLNGNPNIYIMDLATRHLTQITNDYAIDTEPTWAPDASALYFTSNRGGGPEIFRFDFATGQTSRITFDGDYNARSRLTPDAHTLVMMHRQDGAFNIAKQDLTSGRVTVLTDSGADDSPSLAPNGKMVLYGTRFGGHEVLGLVSMDGRVKLRLPSQQGDVQDPSWSPFLK
jgi:TolB protein